MQIIKENEQAHVVVVEPHDIESAIRQFICTCHPEYASNWIINPKYNIKEVVLFSGTKK